MTFPKARLVVSACLFLCWLGFLLYLVVDSPTVIVSKPQFLIASLYVTAEVRAVEGNASPAVTVAEVLWSADGVDAHLAEKTITIADLAKCEKKQGFRGPDKYVLALLKRGASFELAPLPTGELRIYVLTPKTRRQVDTLVAARRS